MLSLSSYLLLLFDFKMVTQTQTPQEREMEETRPSWTDAVRTGKMEPKTTKKKTVAMAVYKVKFPFNAYHHSQRNNIVDNDNGEFQCVIQYGL